MSKKNIKRKVVQVLGSFSIAAIFIVVLIYITNKERSLNLNEIETTKVTRGNVYEVIKANGQVAAENEVLVLCPYTSIVQQIKRLPGNNVKKGELIMTLDTTEIKKRIDNLTDELAMLNNNLLKLQLSSKSIKIDMQHDVEVKKLRIVSLESELNDQNALIEVGGTSQANVEKVKQELVLAKKELYRATEKHGIRLKQLEADETGLNLQIEMKTKQLDEAIQLKKKMMIVSPGKGVILDVNARKGEIVRKDALLVKISEHTKLKIKAAIPDDYQDKIHNGGKVFAIVNKDKLEGTIGNIQPVINDGNIKFEVFLANPQNEYLRVNKEVELLVVTEERSNVLRINKESSQVIARKNLCYIMDGMHAVPRKITTGLQGYEYIEVKEGLDSGEVLIVTDAPAGRNKGFIEIKN